MNKISVVKADDWEGLFINGKLTDEGHTLYEGVDPSQYWQNIFTQYGVGADVKVYWVTDKYYEEYLGRYGSFPENLNEVGIDENN